jgi:hypothetical protein
MKTDTCHRGSAVQCQERKSARRLALIGLTRAPRFGETAYPPPHTLEPSARFRSPGSAPERWLTAALAFKKKHGPVPRPHHR